MLTNGMKALTGVGAIDLGIGQGSGLKRQVDDIVNEQKRKAQIMAAQRQAFPASGMLLGMGGSPPGVL